MTSLPSKIELPVESAPRHVRRRHILEGVVRNNVNNGTNDGFSIFRNFGQKWFEPSLRALAVGVQEGDH